MAISKLISELMEAKGWNLPQTAEHSGVARRTVQEMLHHNYSNLTVRTIKKLALAFGVSPEVIFRELI